VSPSKRVLKLLSVAIDYNNNMSFFSSLFSSSSNFTPILNQYSRDFTAMARKGEMDPVIGREKEITKLIQVLSRRKKNNVILLGPAGVGKTSIVEGLAEKIVKAEVPALLLNKRVIALDLPSIVSGTKYRGEFEQRIKKITDEISQSRRSIILFIDEIHTLVSAGKAEGAIDADDILKPPLARGELQAIGATTNKEYEKYILEDTTLARRFQIIEVKEPTFEECLNILQGIKADYEAYHNVQISDEALVKAIELSQEYIKDRVLPDKAIDLIDEASAKVRLLHLGENTKVEVTAEDIELVVQEYFA